MFKCGHEYEKMFKEKNPTEILTVPGLINNTKEYQKIYNHVWRRHKSILKYRWNEKLFHWRNKAK